MSRDWERDREDRIGPLLVGDRPLPQAPDAERAVLSCLLQDAAQHGDTVFARLPEEQCFHHPPNRTIYEAVLHLRPELNSLSEMDLVTVGGWLQRQGKLDEIGGLEYLSRVAGTAPTTANLDRYLHVVVDAWILRRLIRCGSDLTDKSLSAEGDVMGVLGQAEAELRDISELRAETTIRAMPELVSEAFAHIEQLNKKDQSALGVPTGFIDLDRMITGLKPGDLFVLAARPSIGKTTFAMNICRNVAVETGRAVGFFSLEMGAEQVALRLLCSEARVNLRDIRDGKLGDDGWAQIMEAAGRLRKSKIFIDDTAQLSSVELRQKARRMHQQHNIELIAIDYLQLMRASGMSRNASREQEVARISGDIKAIAKELKVPVVVLAQLNRQAEQTATRPKLSHLRESGAIEQDADVVAILHRERDTDSDRSREDILSNGVPTELIIAKHRNGEVGIVDLVFLGQFTRFENASKYGDEDIA